MDKLKIPRVLDEKLYEQFFCPFIPESKTGRPRKLSNLSLLNYALFVLYTGIQWKSLPIKPDESGEPEIHYSSVFKVFQQWIKADVFKEVFLESVRVLKEKGRLDLDVLHGDGTTTSAKKGGDGIGYNGHKKMKGDKNITICDRKCNVICPFVTAPGNKHEGPLFKETLAHLKEVSKECDLVLEGSIMSLDSAYDSKSNRKDIFNRGMIPNIKENKRNRKSPKKGRKPIYDDEIYDERFHTIEKVFAWEDTFKRLLLRFETISNHFFNFKLLSYIMINIRHFA